MRLKIYEETRTAVRTKDRLSGTFETRKRVEQECVLSPLLFNMYIADLGSCLRKRRI